MCDQPSWVGRWWWIYLTFGRHSISWLGFMWSTLVSFMMDFTLVDIQSLARDLHDLHFWVYDGFLPWSIFNLLQGDLCDLPFVSLWLINLGLIFGLFCKGFTWPTLVSLWWIFWQFFCYLATRKKIQFHSYKGFFLIIIFRKNTHQNSRKKIWKSPIYLFCFIFETNGNLNIFTMQKHNLQKNPLQETQNPSKNIITTLL
jgi:hypothetical protein